MTEIGYKQLRIYGDSKFTRFSDERSEDIIAVGAKWDFMKSNWQPHFIQSLRVWGETLILISPEKTLALTYPHKPFSSTEATSGFFPVPLSLGVFFGKVLFQTLSKSVRPCQKLLTQSKLWPSQRQQLVRRTMTLLVRKCALGFGLLVSTLRAQYSVQFLEFNYFFHIREKMLFSCWGSGCFLLFPSSFSLV